MPSTPPESEAWPAARQTVLAAVWLLGFSLLIRFPFFFPAVIDWDESTHILIGQALLDGELPYTTLWEMKPPLAFLVPAVSLALIGKSVAAVRIGGAICVAIGALFTFLAGRSLWSASAGIVCASLYVALSSFIPSGMATMTEHVALAPLMCSFWLLSTRRWSRAAVASAGALIAVASMVRTNLCYVALIVGLYIVFEGLRAGPARRALSLAIAYGAGGSAVVLLTALPYVITRQFDLWWTAVFAAPFRYAASTMTVVDRLETELHHMKIMIGSLQSAVSVLHAIVWVGGAFGLVLIVVRWRESPGGDGRRDVLLLYTGATLASVLMGGVANAHYLIQLVPFFALAAPQIANSIRVPRVVAFILALCIVFGSVTQVAGEYELLLWRSRANLPLRHGTAYEIAGYVERRRGPGDSIYLMTEHLVYWLTETRPPRKSVTHPANVATSLLPFMADQNATVESEIAKVLATRPRFIVKRRDVWYLSESPAALAYLDAIVAADYKLGTEIDDVCIYELAAARGGNALNR